MRNNLFRKGLVLAIILLFIQTSIGSSITNAIGNDNTNNIEKSLSKAVLKQAMSASIYFTENKGQFPDEVLFQTLVMGVTVYLCKNKIVSVFTKELSHSIGDEIKDNQNLLDCKKLREPQTREMISTVAEFVGANPDTTVTGNYRLPHNNNYFIGNDPLKWRTDVPNYQSITYHDVYPGIDLTYYSNNDGLKYDFIVNPGADVSQIIVRYTGINELNITPEGILQVETMFGKISEDAPLLYQKDCEVTHIIQGRYVLLATNEFGFAIEEYNPVLPLVIDPTLVYSTFLGGTDIDWGYDLVLDSNDCSYITGLTGCNEFPTTPGAYDTSYNLNHDVFVTKLSSSGTTLQYSTFLGGIYSDGGYAITVDTNGYAYVTGKTSSSDFPTTQDAYDTTYNSGGQYADVFVTKLSPAGDALVYSTYLGGGYGDFGYSIELDTIGNAYITGETESMDFPTTPGAYDISYNLNLDAFVTKLSPAGDALVYSTFLGGADWDKCFGIATDANGNAYITGETESVDFPVTPGAYDTSHNSNLDVFVTKLSSAGDTLIYCTFLGGASDERGRDIAVDTDESAFITGETGSDFPTTPGAYDTTNNGGDAFVTKLSQAGNTLIYSTFLGGSDLDLGMGIVVDIQGSSYLTGVTYSSDFPTTPDAYDTTINGGADVFVSTLSPTGNTLIYSTFLGGTDNEQVNDIAINANGYTSVTGFTYSSDFPTTPDAYDIALDGNADVFVTTFKNENENQPPAEKPSGPETGSTTFPYSYTTKAIDPENDKVSYNFSWGDNEFSDWLGPYDSGETIEGSHIWKLDGVYQVQVQVKDINNHISAWSEPLTVTIDPGLTTYRGIFFGIGNEVPGDTDAERFFYKLSATGKNWLSDNMLIYTNANADSNNYNFAMNWIVVNSDSNDVSLFFFSGHGNTLGKDYYISFSSGLAINQTTLNHGYGAISGFGDIKGDLIVILHSCNSGGFIDELQSLNRVIITACQADESARPFLNIAGWFVWYMEMGLSIFFKHALADGNFDGYVTIEELYKYAWDNIWWLRLDSWLLRLLKFQQHPQMNDGNPDLEMILAEVNA